MAERQGFEPWVGANRQRFSRPPHSTTLPPLRGRDRGGDLAGSRGACNPDFIVVRKIVARKDFADWPRHWRFVALGNLPCPPRPLAL